MKEGRRVRRRYAYRLSAAQSDALDERLSHLGAGLRGQEPLEPAVESLDDVLDGNLGFARKSTAREYAESIGVAVLIALFLRAFVVEAFKIPSGSMIPTLAGRRSHLRQQVHLRRARAVHQHQVRRWSIASRSAAR